MKANHLPELEEVQEILREGRKPLFTAEEYQDTRASAVIVAELLSQQRIQETQEGEEVLLLQDQPFFLNHFPIRQAVVEGQKDKVDVDLSRGIIHHSLPPDSYRVRYLVGFEEGKVPALLKELIKNICLATKDPVYLDQVTDLANIAKIRRQAEREFRGR